MHLLSWRYVLCVAPLHLFNFDIDGSTSEFVVDRPTCKHGANTICMVAGQEQAYFIVDPCISRLTSWNAANTSSLKSLPTGPCPKRGHCKPSHTDPNLVGP